MKKVFVLVCAAFFTTNIFAQPFFPKRDLMTVGVYYYPEHWPEQQWERDIKAIADHGFEFIHMAEFAWAQMEPSEGEFDFGWLDTVVALAKKHHLKVLLGTPTPCPPVWLGRKHPDIYLQDANYQTKEHGTRANFSLSNPTVRTYTAKIVEALARRYGQHPAVMGWQVDNEPEAKEDYSPAAQQAFRTWLKDKYKEVQGLNTAWGTAFWSQVYTDFEQVQIPNANNVGWWGANPMTLLDYKRFCADQQAGFLDFQAMILRKYIAPQQFITTNYVAKGSQADPLRTRHLDFPAYTAYPNYGSSNLGHLGFRLGDPSVLLYANDFYKSMNGVTGVMELQPGQVNWASYNALLQPGTVRMWLWHAFAGGSSFACTYRYRQVLFGAEQYHHGIVTTDGVTLSDGGKEYVQVINEIKQVRKEYQTNATMPKSMVKKQTAVLWSYENVWSLDRQRQTYQWDTWKLLQRYQSMLNSLGAPVVFINEDDDFSNYPFLVVPAYELVDEALVAKWMDYVKGGGQLIIGPRTGAKTKQGHLWESNLSGVMNELIGARVMSFDMLPAGVQGQFTSNDKTFAWSTWAEQLLPDDKTRVLATYSDQFYRGAVGAVCRSHGKGTVYYLGINSLDGFWEKEVFRQAFQKQGLTTANYPEGVFVNYRDGFMVAVNYSSQVYTLDYNGPYLIGDKQLAPADVAVWKAE